MAVEPATFEVEPLRAPTDYHAIWSGFIAGLSLLLLLHVLGDAIGLAVTAPGSGGARSISAGTVLWTLGIPCACAFVGGVIAAVLSRSTSAIAGVLHGTLVWGLGVLFLSAVASIVRPGAAPGNGDFYWLLFFTMCLALFGAAFGGFLGTRPKARILYERRHGLVHQPA